jgi:catechol 2,3-dioxygenase-like lactoylglutathione lyase family enzyme
MSNAVINQINLVCGDPDASIAFYRKLGVEILDAQV